MQLFFITICALFLRTLIPRDAISTSILFTTKHVGIDLSAQAIAAAIAKSKEIAKFMPDPQFLFTCGSLEALQPIASASMDGAILSNIIDNLYPEDAHHALTEIKRILKPEGRLLVKLNPLLTPEQILEYGVKIIKDNLLDDGMILWNNSTKDWYSILSSYFDIDQFKNIYYEEHDQYNRLYQLIKS